MFSGTTYRTNAYIDDPLENYKKIKLEEIKNYCTKINLSETKIEEVQQAFLSKLQEINFLEAYTNNRIKQKKETAISYDNLTNFIHETNKNLQDIENFVTTTLGITAEKQKIMNKMVGVKNTINEYRGNNKKSILSEFNKHIDSLLNSMEKKSCIDVMADAVKEMHQALAALQVKETGYYDQLSFFREKRRSSSSLQKKIDIANEILNSDDKQQKKRRSFS